MSTPPPCVGTYEHGHEQCDGSNQDPRPCTWRDKCVALELHCKAMSLDLSKYIDPDTDEPRTAARSFSDFCLQLTKDFNVVNGEQQERAPEPVPEILEPLLQPIKKKRKHKSQPRLKGTSSGYFATKRETTLQLLEHFDDRLMVEVPDRTMARGNQSVVPGQFYKVDRLAKSQYVVFYCRKARGWNVGLASVRIKPRTGTVDILLSVKKSQLAKALPKRLFNKLKLKATKSGCFILRASGLDREGVGIVARAIGKMVASGTIEMPKAEG